MAEQCNYPQAHNAWGYFVSLIAEYDILVLMSPTPTNHLTKSVTRGIRDVAIAATLSFFVFLGSFFFMTAALYLFFGANPYVASEPGVDTPYPFIP